jgi:hypothetical protein
MATQSNRFPLITASAASRRRTVDLASTGHDYAEAVIESHAPNNELTVKVHPGYLDTAHSVPTFVKDNFGL